MGARAVGRLGAVRLPSWPIMRRRLLALAVLFVALMAAYLLWFRDSSFVRVTNVEVSGAAADPGVESALRAAGIGLSTLDLDRDALQAAVADDPGVAALGVETDLPHGLRIAVELRRPVAYVAADGGTVIAADGVVLGTGVDRPKELPLIDVDGASVAGERAEGPALALARILGAAPGKLAAAASGATIDAEGSPTVTVEGGMELRFGDPSGAPAKWRAAAAVIADPRFGGADYIDLAVPSRPVAG